MNCCICGKTIEKDKHDFLIGGSTVVVDSGFGSTHDGETRKGFICDDCIPTLKHCTMRSEF
jgi:hypothetical protein